MFTPAKTHGNLIIDIGEPYFGSTAELLVTDFQAEATKLRVGVVDYMPLTGWYPIILMRKAYPLINLTGTTQFRLRFGKGDNDDKDRDYLKIFSGDAPKVSRPQLIIEYYTP